MIDNYLYTHSNDQAKKKLKELNAKTELELKNKYICPACGKNEVECFIIGRDPRYGSNFTTGKELIVSYYVRCTCGHDCKSTSLARLIVANHRLTGTFTNTTNTTPSVEGE